MYVNCASILLMTVLILGKNSSVIFVSVIPVVYSTKIEFDVFYCQTKSLLVQHMVDLADILLDGYVKQLQYLR